MKAVSIKVNFLLLLKVVFLGTLAYFLLRDFNVSYFLSSFQRVSYGYAATSIFSFLLGLIILAFRWYCILYCYFISLPFKLLCEKTLIGFSLGQLLPTSIGGDAYRVFSLKKYGGKEIFLSVFLDRLYGFMSLLTFVLIFLPSQLHYFYPISSMERVLESGILLSVFLIIFFLFIKKLKSHVAFIGVIFSYLEALKRYFSFSRNDLFIFFLSFFGGCLAMVPFYFIAQDLDISLTLSQILFTMSLVSILAILPLSLAGWGLREASVVIILSYYGISKEKALALSLAFGTVQLFVAIPGLIIWLLKRKKKI